LGGVRRAEILPLAWNLRKMDRVGTSAQSVPAQNQFFLTLHALFIIITQINLLGFS
jgi:hypothetical protein